MGDTAKKRLDTPLSRKPRPTGIDLVQAPGWSRLKWLRHGFSTRTGGVSVAYRSAAAGDSGKPGPTGNPHAEGELNLGFNDSDSPDHVLQNRAAFLRAVQHSRSLEKPNPGPNPTPALKLVTLKQIHSSLVHRAGTRDAATETTLKGDGLMTDEPGIMLGILTADCIPVLIADRKRHAVAAFHAGWRGTLKRIVENGVGRMRLEFGSHPADLIAAIGPGIGPCCYSVGEEVRQEFDSQFAYADQLFHEVYDSDPIRQRYPMLFLTARAPGHSSIGPQTHLDLFEANKRQLLAAGLAPSAIFVAGECTGCRTDRFFSHRAEHGFTGRMMSLIGIAAGTS